MKCRRRRRAWNLSDQ